MQLALHSRSTPLLRLASSLPSNVLIRPFATIKRPPLATSPQHEGDMPTATNYQPTPQPATKPQNQQIIKTGPMSHKPYTKTEIVQPASHLSSRPTAGPTSPKMILYENDASTPYFDPDYLQLVTDAKNLNKPALEARLCYALTKYYHLCDVQNSSDSFKPRKLMRMSLKGWPTPPPNPVPPHSPCRTFDELPTALPCVEHHMQLQVSKPYLGSIVRTRLEWLQEIIWSYHLLFDPITRILREPIYSPRGAPDVPLLTVSIHVMQALHSYITLVGHSAPIYDSFSGYSYRLKSGKDFTEGVSWAKGDRYHEHRDIVFPAEIMLDTMAAMSQPAANEVDDGGMLLTNHTHTYDTPMDNIRSSNAPPDFYFNARGDELGKLEDYEMMLTKENEAKAKEGIVDLFKMNPEAMRPPDMPRKKNGQKAKPDFSEVDDSPHMYIPTRKPPPISTLMTLSPEILNILLFATPYRTEGHGKAGAVVGYEPTLAYGRDDRTTGRVTSFSTDKWYDEKAQRRVITARQEVCQILESWVLVGKKDWRDYIEPYKEDCNARKAAGVETEDGNSLVGQFSSRCLFNMQKYPLASRLSLNKLVFNLQQNIAQEYSDINKRNDAFRMFNVVKHNMHDCNATKLKQEGRMTRAQMMIIPYNLYMALLKTCLLATPHNLPRLIPAAILLNELCLMHGSGGKITGNLMQTVIEDAVRYGNSRCLRYMLDVMQFCMEKTVRGKSTPYARIKRMQATHNQSAFVQSAYFISENSLPSVISVLGSEHDLRGVRQLLALRLRFNELVETGQRRGEVVEMNEEAWGSLLYATARSFGRGKRKRKWQKENEEIAEMDDVFNAVEDMIRAGFDVGTELRNEVGECFSMKVATMDAAYYAMMDHIERRGVVEDEAERELWSKFDNTIFHAILHSSALRGDVERTFATFEEVERLGIQVEPEAFVDLLRVCSNSLYPNQRAADTVLEEMKDSGAEIDEEARHHLVDIYIKDKRWDSKLLTAYGMVEKSMAEGEIIKESTFVNLARSLGTRGYWDHVDIVMEWIQHRFGEIPGFLRVRLEPLRQRKAVEDAQIGTALQERERANVE